jgi:hypothetical protein
VSDEWAPTAWRSVLTGRDKHQRVTLVHLTVTETSGFGFSPHATVGVNRKWDAKSEWANATGTASSLEEAKELAAKYGQQLLKDWCDR